MTMEIDPTPIDERLYWMAADFIARTPLLHELPHQPRVIAVGRALMLIQEAEEALASKPDLTSYVSHVGRTFSDGSAWAMADRGLVRDGEVTHDLNLWDIGHLKDYLSYRRESGRDVI